MWKDSIEVKVIRLEGFPCSSTELALYLYADDALHDQLLPITEEKALVLSLDATYKLEIINQNTQEEKTISFKRDLFKEDGVRWLPLFSQSDDYISTLPEEVMLPRILLIFYSKTKLASIEEHSSEEILESEPLKSTYEINDEPLVAKIVTDEKLLQDYKNALEFERKLRDEQEKNMKNMEKKLKDALERSQKREDSLLQLINSNEEELIAAQNEIASLRAKIRRLEHENTQYIDLAESYKAEKECLNYEGLRKELEVFTHYFRDCEEVKEFKAKLEAYENKEQEALELERLVLEGIKGRSNDVKKGDEIVYVIGGKRISLTNHDGCLLYRSLGTLQKFDDFFASGYERSMTPSSKINRRNGLELKSLESESKEFGNKRVNTSFYVKKPVIKH
ncbi:hypothetical protein SteCoe_35414 [Stentor coeruleus]|uniref:Uncharacterized protein n=1 Tax=Stentor coeruleus TaxID=5963 RepID=A0A1R2ASB9_9CILI|nr:hypothetical protein SteCoe_35414 [Stentor coeruleus]